MIDADKLLAPFTDLSKAVCAGSDLDGCLDILTTGLSRAGIDSVGLWSIRAGTWAGKLQAPPGNMSRRRVEPLISPTLLERFLHQRGPVLFELWGRMHVSSSLWSQDQPRGVFVLGAEALSLEELIALAERLNPHLEQALALIYHQAELWQSLDRFREQLFSLQRMEVAGRLAAGVAHDFNSLLGIICASAEVVREEISDRHPSSEDLDRVIQACGTAARLGRRLLDFGHQRVPISSTGEIDANEVLQEASKTLEAALGKQLAVRVKCSPVPAPIQLDKIRFEQVVLNLALNARDAMPNGGTLTLELSVLDGVPSRFARLLVSDTGCGMDAETVERVFEPFFTTKGEAGTGLGLTTVSTIVQQAGGGVLVSSSPGGGTTFQVCLPCAPL